MACMALQLPQWQSSCEVLDVMRPIAERLCILIQRLLGAMKVLGHKPGCSRWEKSSHDKIMHILLSHLHLSIILTICAIISMDDDCNLALQMDTTAFNLT